MTPAKLLRIHLRQTVPLGYFPDDDGWQGYPYAWDATIDVIPQVHGSNATPTPYAYTADDVKVGDYIVTNGSGRVLKITQISVVGPTYFGCVLEDENRTNILEDPTASGDGNIPGGEGLLFEAKNGWPILHPIPSALAGQLPPYFASDILGRFIAAREAGNVNLSLTEIRSDTGASPPAPTEFRITTTTDSAAWTADESWPWGRLSFYSEDTSLSGGAIHAAIDISAFDSAGGKSNLSFKTWDGSTLAPRLTISPAGNIDINSEHIYVTTTAAAKSIEHVFQVSSASNPRLLIGTGSNIGSSVCGVEFQDRLGGVDVPHSYGQITGFVRCERVGDAANFKLLLGAAYTTNLDAQSNVVVRGSADGGKLGVNIDPAAPLHVQPPVNSEAIRVWSIGGISSVGGGYSAFTQNAYSFGDPFKFKRLTSNASVGVGVITASRSPLGTNTGGVWVTSGSTDVTAEINWGDMTPAITWSGTGEICIGHETPSMGDVSSIKPLLHVKKAGNTGATNWVARFQAGADADYTSSAIVLNHDNDRGMFLEGGRSFGNTAFGSLGLIDNAGTKLDAVTLLQSGAAVNLGINEPFPQYPLDVDGRIRFAGGTDTAPGLFTVTGGTTTGIYSDSSNSLSFSAAASRRLYISPAGNTRVDKKAFGLYTPGYINRDGNSTLWHASRLAGRVVNKNPQFIDGTTNGYSIYNLSGGTALTHTILSEGGDAEATYIPNATAKCLKISYNGLGPVAPGGGGFWVAAANITGNGKITNYDRYRRAQRHIIKIVAKIPIGLILEHRQNTITGSETQYLTPQDGTGTWTEYVISVQLGYPVNGNSYNSTHYFNLGNASSFTSTGTPFDWYVASCEITDVDAPREVVNSPGLSVGYDEAYNNVSAGFGGIGALGNIILGGKLGVAHAAPQAALHVREPDVVGTESIVVLEGSSWGGGEALDITWRRAVDVAAISAELAANVISSTLVFKTGNNDTNSPALVERMRLNDAGLSIDKIYGPTGTLNVTGDMTVAGHIQLTGPKTDGSIAVASAVYNNDPYRVSQYIAPKNNTHRTAGPDLVGKIKIVFPVAFTNTMVTLSVTVYEYYSGATKKFQLSGYIYNGGGPDYKNKRWLNTAGTYIQQTRTDDEQYALYFGADNSSGPTAPRATIWIEKRGGVKDGKWDYPQICVHDVQASFSSHSADLWDKEWSVSIVDETPTGYVDDTGTEQALNVRFADAPLMVNYLNKITNDFQIGTARETVSGGGNVSGAVTVDISASTQIVYTLTGSTTFTLPTPEAGRSFTMIVRTGSGGYGVSFSSNVRWPNDTQPVMTISSLRTDIFMFFSDGSNFWYGMPAQNYSTT